MPRHPQGAEPPFPRLRGTTRRTFAIGLLCLAGTSPVRAEWAGSPPPEVPLEGDGTAWLVRATVNDRAHGRFLVDTGSSLCVLTPGTAARLTLEKTGRTLELQTANGVVRKPVMRLTSLAVGPSRVGGVDAVVHDGIPDSIDGIIGLSFLNHFSYAIDPRRRTLRLR